MEANPSWGESTPCMDTCSVMMDAFMGNNNAMTSDDDKTNQGPLGEETIERMSPFSSLFPSHMFDESGLEIAETTSTSPIAHSKPTPNEAISCSKCSYICVDHKELMKHRRRHVGEKGYKCSDCPASFTRQSTLSKHHLQKHQNAYKCALPKCKYISMSMEALELHKRSVHSLGSGAYYCKACQARYRLRSSLLNHLTRSHGSDATLIGVGDEATVQTAIPPTDKKLTPDAPVTEVSNKPEETVNIYTMPNTNAKQVDALSPPPTSSKQEESISVNEDDKRIRLRPRVSNGQSDSNSTPTKRAVKRNSKGGKALFACDRCSYTAKTFRALFSHKKGKHPPNEITAPHCVYCWKKFSSVDRLMSHIRGQHIGPAATRRKKSSRSYACRLCHFNTTTKRVFTAHKKMHQNETNRKKKSESVCRRRAESETSSLGASVSPQSLGTGPIQLPPLPIPIDLGVIERTAPEIEACMIHLQEANRQLMQLTRRRESEMSEVRANVIQLLRVGAPNHPFINNFNTMQFTQLNQIFGQIVSNCLDQFQNNSVNP